MRRHVRRTAGRLGGYPLLRLFRRARRRALAAAESGASAQLAAFAALEASEARLRAATEGSLDAFYLLRTVREAGGAIADFEFVDCNARGAALVGGTREALLGTRLCPLIPRSRESRLFDRLARVAERGRPLEEELPNEDPPIRARWLRLQVVPVADGIAVTARDISERKQVERALLDSERRFRDLLGNVRLVAVALDTAGRVTFGNAALLELTGWTREELVGRDWFATCLGDADGALLERYRTAGADGVAPHEEREIVTRAGERRLVAWDTTVLRDAAGRMIGTSSLGADVTDQKRHENALRESKEAAEEARARAEEASRAKSEFLARMSHELRTPLNSVIGFSTVLLRNAAGTLTEQEVSCAERINANGRHLLELINDILDLSKVEAGRMTLDVAPVPLSALVRATAALFEPRAAGGAVTLAVEVPPGELRVTTDEGKLQQVLINLIGNALKFTERGQVTVRLVADPVTGAPRCIEVADTGIGIAPDRVAAIFEAFEQADAGTTRKYGGTGLGLAISRAFCELMGHTLAVESRPGEGSTFRVVLGAA